MKRTTIQALVIAVSLAMASTAFAQGRHDEKPHGQQKPAQAAKEGEAKSQPMAGGRHDERPHGTQKSSVKKETANKGDMEKKEMMKGEMMKNEGEMGKGMK